MGSTQILFYGLVTGCAVLAYLRVVAVAIDHVDAAAHARDEQSRREKKVPQTS